jgi:hypothetical protein
MGRAVAESRFAKMLEMAGFIDERDTALFLALAEYLGKPARIERIHLDTDEKMEVYLARIGNDKGDASPSVDDTGPAEQEMADAGTG